jgi:hypothetical protein
MSVQIMLEAHEMEETAAIDPAPVSCVSSTRTTQASRFVDFADATAKHARLSAVHSIVWVG